MPLEILKPNVQVTPNMKVSGDVTAELNYIKPDTTVTPEVVYSGGDAPQSYNEAYAFMEAPIYDGRVNSETFDIHTQGFQLVNSPTKASGFDNQETVEGAYYDEVKAIVRETTGAKEVFVFDHIVRLGEKNSRRKPAHHVHNDYSQRTAHIRAEERIGAARFAELKNRRMIQINVWRPLVDHVQRSPLAFCDATTIEPKDLIPTNIRFPDTGHVGEIYALRKNPSQRWSYFSEMTKDEVVLIKGYDSLTEGVARFTPHTAFEYPDQDPAVPARKSIETRTFAFY